MPTRLVKAPSPSRQIGFHQLLVAARKTWLIDALKDALGNVNPDEVKRQVSKLVPPDVQQILATSGIRDEFVFPTPIVLEAKPTLIGYYRLLLGTPQKSFYSSGTGMSLFKSMEIRGLLSKAQKAALPDFCSAISQAMTDLVRQMSPAMSDRDVRELPILTIGAQFQGSNNTKIGKQAVVNVFIAVSGIVKGYIISQDDRKLLIKNSSQRKVIIKLGSDPDIGIHEEFGTQCRTKVAIEIKGGTDRSNVHNRAGEAEKSHQKAKRVGFRDFWTLISKKGIDMKKIQAESPTTTSWFDVSEVLGQQGNDWEEFRSRLAGEVGIPVR
jgi:hypothetical protein